MGITHGLTRDLDQRAPVDEGKCRPGIGARTAPCLLLLFLTNVQVVRLVKRSHCLGLLMPVCHCLPQGKE